MLAIGADEPFAGNETTVDAGTAKIKTRNSRAPQEADSGFRRAINQKLVEGGAAQTQAPSPGNFSADGRSFVREPKAIEGETRAGIKINSETAQRRNRFGQ